MKQGYTDEAVERGARVLAEALNGGSWLTHYTPAQRDLWRDRVRALAHSAPKSGAQHDPT